MSNILIKKNLIEALISWIPNDGSQSAGLVNEVLALIAPKKPEVAMRLSLAFDATCGGNNDVAKLAGIGGCMIACLSCWPTEVIVIKNIPDAFVGTEIWFERIKGVEYTDAQVLKMVEAKFAEAKGK